MHAGGEGLPPQTPQGPRGAWCRAQGKAACAQIVLKALVQLLLAARERRWLRGPLLLWAFETGLPTLPPRTAQPPPLWGLLRLPWPAPSGPHFPPGIQGLSRWLQPHGHHCTLMLHISLSSFHLVPLLFSSRGDRPFPPLLSKLNTRPCSSRTTVAHSASPCLETPSQALPVPLLSSLAHPRSLSVSHIQQTPTKQKGTSS